MTNDQILDLVNSEHALSEEEIARLRREVLVGEKSAEELIHERRLVPDETLAKL